MKVKKDNVQVSVQLSKRDKERFERLYPYMLSKFLKSAFDKALKDRSYFISTIFGDN